MYNKTITLNGIEYNLSSDAPITPELEKSTLQKASIQKLTPTCPPSAKISGETVTLKCTPTSGVGTFTVTFFKGVTQIAQYTEVPLNTEVSTSNVTTSADATTGYADYSTTVVDKCLDPSPQTVTESCRVQVQACPLLQFNFTVS